MTLHPAQVKMIADRQLKRTNHITAAMHEAGVTVIQSDEAIIGITASVVKADQLIKFFEHGRCDGEAIHFTVEVKAACTFVFCKID